MENPYAINPSEYSSPAAAPASDPAADVAQLAAKFEENFPGYPKQEAVKAAAQAYPALAGNTVDEKWQSFMNAWDAGATKITQEYISRHKEVFKKGEEEFSDWRDQNKFGKMLSGVAAGLRAGYGAPEALHQDMQAWNREELLAKDRTIGKAQREIEAEEKAQNMAKGRMDMKAQALNMGLTVQQADNAQKKFEAEYAALTEASKAAARARDPNSIESQTMRNLAKQVGANITGTETAEVLSKVIPVQTEVFKAMVDAQAKKQAQAVAWQELAIKRQEAETRQAREEREARERSPTHLGAVEAAKDQAKEDVKKAAANKETIKNVTTTLLPAIDEALKATAAAGSFSTGPIAGRVPMVSKEGQKVENAYAKVQLEAVKAFTAAGGSSQMLNSNAEREAFQAAGPNVRADADVNRQVLLGQRALAVRTLELAKNAEAAREAAAARAQGVSEDKIPKFKTPDEIFGEVAVYDPKNPGRMHLVPKNQLEFVLKNTPTLKVLD